MATINDFKREISELVKAQKVERPTREQLKELIRFKPFTQIGKDFGVSDNAVRKWCKSYNLPTKTSDIKWINL